MKSKPKLHIVCFLLLVYQTALPSNAFNQYSYKVSESSQVGSIVTDLSTTNHFTNVNFATSDLVVQKYFSIEPSKGLIKVKSDLDLENTQLCIDNTKCCQGISTVCKFDFYLQIKYPDREPDIVEAQIKIIDANDNYPRFPPHTLHTSFKEGPDEIGTERVIESATDADFNVNHRVTDYRLMPKHAAFRLFEKNERLVLRLIQELDREEKAYYLFQVVSIDGGGKQGSAQLNVTVLDKNEHAPHFLDDSKTYFTISEDKPAGYVITKVTATDEDAPPNNRIIYMLDPGSNALHKRTFRVNSETGELSLKQPLDFEMLEKYQLHILAKDSSSNGDSKSASKMITILVEDTNDNKPTIQLVGEYSKGVWVDENMSKGTKVATLIVNDKDKGDNGQVVCQLQSGSDKFHLASRSDPILYKLEIKAPLDRELKEQYHVKIWCKDHGVPPRMNSLFLTVRVRDKNDERPVFEKPVYNLMVKENSHIGEALRAKDNQSPSSVIAHDADISDKLIYTLENSEADDGQLFKILPNGTIITNSHLNREIKESLTFKVCAYDGQVKVCANVFVTVIDVNDNSPILDQEVYILKIMENQQRSDPLITFVATDEDSGNKGFQYALTDADNNKLIRRHFYLRNNQLILRAPLDREEASEYHFGIRVTDNQPGGGPSHTSQASIFISVLDENDNVPRFIFPNTTHNTTNVSCLESAGTSLVRIQAVDKDDGINGKVRYGISSAKPPESQRLLHLDADRGEIFMGNAMLRKFCGQVFELHVFAEDMGDISDFSSLNGNTAEEIIQKSKSVVKSVMYLRVMNIPPRHQATVGSLPPRLVLCIILGVTTLFLVFLVVTWLFLLVYRRRRNGDSADQMRRKREELSRPNISDVYTEHLINAVVDYEGAPSDVTSESRLGYVTPPPKTIRSIGDDDSGCYDHSSRDSWRLGSVDTSKGRITLDHSKKYQTPSLLASLRSRTSSSLARIGSNHQTSLTPCTITYIDPQHRNSAAPAKSPVSCSSGGSSSTGMNAKPFLTPQMHRKALQQDASAGSGGDGGSNTHKDNYNSTRTPTAIQKRTATLPREICQVHDQTSSIPGHHAATISRSGSKVRCRAIDFLSDPDADIYTTLIHQKCPTSLTPALDSKPPLTLITSKCCLDSATSGVRCTSQGGIIRCSSAGQPGQSQKVDAVPVGRLLSLDHRSGETGAYTIVPADSTTFV